MWAPGGGTVALASIVAGAPACGIPPLTVSATTGLPGVAGSGNATPLPMVTASPLLDASQRRSPGLAARGSGFAPSGITSHGPPAEGSGGAWPNAAQRNAASPPETSAGSKVKENVSSPPDSLVPMALWLVVTLPARAWQLLVQSVPSRRRSWAAPVAP